jgi:hypothetical protein
MGNKIKNFLVIFLASALTAISCITIKPVKKETKPQTPLKQKQLRILYSKAESMSLGTHVTVILRSGVRMVGEYAGLSRVSSEKYAEIYAESRERNKEEVMLPALGESVILVTKGGKRYSCELLGFNFNYLLIRYSGKTETSTIKIRVLKNIINSNGNAIAKDKVIDLISKGKIPNVSSGIALRGKSGPVQIAWQDIHDIKKRAKIEKILVKLAGMTVAVVATILILDSFAKSVEELGNIPNKIFPIECAFELAASGSPLYAHLDNLREFRDAYLMSNKLGRKLVKLYYTYSPFGAYLIAKNKDLKIGMCIFLLPLILFSYSIVHFGPVITAIIFALIFFLMIFVFKSLKETMARRSR